MKDGREVNLEEGVHKVHQQLQDPGLGYPHRHHRRQHRFCLHRGVSSANLRSAAQVEVHPAGAGQGQRYPSVRGDRAAVRQSVPSQAKHRQ